jgi:hypothetical protein
MPRSERGRIRGNCSTLSPCFPWRKRLPPAVRLALAERPQGSQAHRAGASHRRGLSPAGDRRWRAAKAVGEALRTVASAWVSDMAELEDDRGPAGSAGAARAGRDLQRRVEDGFAQNA